MRRILLFLLVAYSFLFGILGREVGGFQYGLLFEAFILITWMAVAAKTPKEEYSRINSDLFYLFLLWFVISILQVVNPGSSVLGWLAEIRTAAFYPFMIVGLGLLIFRSHRDLDIFLILVIGLSTLASINGIKQLYLGPWPGEQRFLNEGGYVTHILWGQLRVFSFYSDAGQFGASQAHVGLMSIILALGRFKRNTRLLLLGCGLILLYGMLISGTRGALFALIVGVFTAIILSKNLKVILIGGLFACSFLFILKFTYIGNGNYQIYRLRTAVNPEDPSLNLRFNTQRMLREYMSSRPFGGGLGVIGHNGTLYNADRFLSKVPPDSYYVKVWAMYGIVGFTIWLGIMLYILGKCCGIVWNIKDSLLKVKMIALTSGFAGILVCSYGNEVINNMPSLVVISLSLVFVFIANRMDETPSVKLLT
jgi:O-antigen ligase